MHRASVKAAEVQSLAARLGRQLADRGKHPMWVNSQFPKLRPLSIPDHGGRDLSLRVRKCVLLQLEDDVLAWDEWISKREDSNGNGYGH